LGSTTSSSPALELVARSHSRAELYGEIVPPLAHDMHWHYETTYVPLSARAEVR
jgi:hypothetical protein